MSRTPTDVENEMKRIVGMALRAENDDVVALGRIFHENVAHFIATHTGPYTISSLLNTLAVSGASLSRAHDAPSVLFKARALGRAGDDGQMVHVLINRGPVSEGVQPRLLADTTLGDVVSYPNPRWAGRFMARIIRTPDDIGHAIRMLFSMLMILQSGDSRDGMLSAVARDSDDGIEDFSVREDDLLVTMLVGRHPDGLVKVPASAEERRLNRLSQTLEVPHAALSRAVSNLKTKGYRVSRIDERGDWAMITYIPQGA